MSLMMLDVDVDRCDRVSRGCFGTVNVNLARVAGSKHSIGALKETLAGLGKGNQ
jgi:hypothetical protein